MTMVVKPAVKLLSFMVLCWLLGAFTADLILDDLAYWWATIPAVALFGFVGYRAMRVKVNREQFYLAMLLAMMVTAAMGKLWP